MEGDIMYTKTEILQIVKEQLALDYNCKVSDFEKKSNTVVENKLIEGRRIYKNDGCFMKIICFGGTAIISASPAIKPWCEEKLINMEAAWLFQYPKLRTMDNKLQEFGQEVAGIHHYYLPNENVLLEEPISNVKWYNEEDILQFKGDERFEEAFGFNESHPDVLAVAALDGDTIMGMAGASSDSETMWQIGIDVLPEYRSRGIGTNLVSLLKNEIFSRGKIPFYGTAQSHIHSQNIAANSGFCPAWVELYSKEK
jgi:GNAT superfamily N-acetyltransferase